MVLIAFLMHDLFIKKLNSSEWNDIGEDVYIFNNWWLNVQVWECDQNIGAIKF